ncbi:hypothetical protein GOC60_17195 [Sinorhizobium meliloti]|nr:hypothetical protein [Sinorhizobium meliloti]MDX0350199.1 hypothetical protein [Sinorhizobium meliloti]
MDIAQKIRDQIAHHRAELLRLESALEVIGEVTGKPAKAEKPMITIRKTIDHDSAPPAEKKKRPKPNRAAAKKLEAVILADIVAHGPSYSAAITGRVKADRKAIWNRLYAMHTRGALLRSKDGVYSVPGEGEKHVSDLVQEGGAHPGAGVEQAA